MRWGVWVRLLAQLSAWYQFLHVFVCLSPVREIHATVQDYCKGTLLLCYLHVLLLQGRAGREVRTITSSDDELSGNLQEVPQF